MIRSSIKATCVAGAVSAFLFGAFGSPLAIEQDFADYNCAITFPGGWHSITRLPSQPSMAVVAAYSDTTGRRIVALTSYNKKPTGPLDDHFIADFEQELGGTGRDNRLSSKYIDVGGIKSYRRLGGFDLHGKYISTLHLLVPGEAQYLIVVAMRSDGDVSEDPEIQQAIGSFRFIHPFVPTYDSIPYRIGRMTVPLMAIIIVVAVIARSLRPNRV